MLSRVKEIKEFLFGKSVEKEPLTVEQRKFLELAYPPTLYDYEEDLEAEGNVFKVTDNTNKVSFYVSVVEVNGQIFILSPGRKEY